jgi:site-specific DNA-methyltransferase (adenine-specific)
MTLPLNCEILHGDCVEHMRAMPDACVDAVVTDPPYLISFMGRKWDAADGIAGSPDVWREVLRVLKPGGHMLAFGAPRTYHRMACAIEDAGFEIRDCIRSLNGQEHYPAWVFGSGFPKAEQWTQAKADAGNAESAMMVEAGFEGWARGGVKPAWEPVAVARKPLSESSVAANVLKHGVGGLNIGACRIEGVKGVPWGKSDTRPAGKEQWRMGVPNDGMSGRDANSGRFPANLIHDGSPQVLDAFAAFGESKSSDRPRKNTAEAHNKTSSMGKSGGDWVTKGHSDSGTAARFFYSAKASKQDRADSKHPTVKPISLMRYLCKLVCPTGGTVLDPFAGSGTTLAAAHMEGFHAIGIEQELEYITDIRRRMAALAVAPQPAPQGGLFADLDAAE